MFRIAVDQLQEGQVLAQDVTRQDGMVLMPRGREITAEVISLLKRMEVDQVVVEGDHFASEEERQAFLAQQEKDLNQRFSRVEGDPVLMGLRELFRRQIQRGYYPRPRPQPPEPEPEPGPADMPGAILSKKDRQKK